MAPATPTLDLAGLGADEGAAPLAQTGPVIDIQNDYDMGGKKDRTTVGVGEKTSFSIPGETGSWKASDGRGKVDSEGFFVWTAGETAGAVTITVTAADKSTSAVTMNVKTPATITGANAKDAPKPAGKAGGGMTLDLIVGPTDVSFSNVLWSEVAGPASNLKGYFDGKSPPSHTPAPESNPGEKNDIQDTATFAWDGAKPWAQGSYDWVVPNQWRLKGGKAQPIQDVTQTHEIIDATGSGRTSKAGKTSGASS